jgi:hypothetical protein
MYSIGTRLKRWTGYRLSWKLLWFSLASQRGCLLSTSKLAMIISFQILIYFPWSLDAILYNFSSWNTSLGYYGSIRPIHTIVLIMQLAIRFAFSMLDNWLQVKLKCSPPLQSSVVFTKKEDYGRGSWGQRGCCDAWPMMHSYCPAVRAKHGPQFSTPVAAIYFTGFAIQLAETTPAHRTVFRQPAKPKVT